MVECQECGLLFRSELAIDEHMATNHTFERVALDEAAYWETDNRKSVREKYRSVYGPWDD